MSVITQGEKLLLLVRRDRRTTEEIAIAMNIDKSYLPRLYKMEILPAKPLKKALEVFGPLAAGLLEDGPEPSRVSEPKPTYPEQSPLLAAQAENAVLREDLRRLSAMLEQERAINANLAEALKNLSKRD